jgi:hypothetical protein
LVYGKENNRLHVGVNRPKIRLNPTNRHTAQRRPFFAGFYAGSKSLLKETKKEEKQHRIIAYSRLPIKNT